MAAAASSSSPVAALGADGECTLLGGPFAICVQIGLAAAAIATLVVKRHTERPRRPWLVWFFDASKQAFAGFLQHCVNLVFGVAFAASGAASECAWYLTNFVISVMCGVLLLNLAMAGYNRCVDRFGLHLLRSGEYGKPPSWRPWLMQMLVWGFLASAEKVATALVVLFAPSGRDAPPDVHHLCIGRDCGRRDPAAAFEIGCRRAANRGARLPLPEGGAL